MKAAITFNLDDPDDRNEHHMAVHGKAAYGTLCQVIEDIFRPARKHGYGDKHIEALIEKCGAFTDAEGEESNAGLELLWQLETRFRDILEENGIDLTRHT